MANTFYDPGRQRAAKVNALFSQIAARYDLINDLQSFGLHRYWKGRVIRMAAATAGTRALDACCGTGDLAFSLARRGARVVGLDFGWQMLKQAQVRGKNQNSNPSFICGDAQNLPFSDETFDILTIGYGLRNLADWEAGLREMLRVAKPGGRVLVLDFGKPNNPLWRALYFCYLRLFVPWLGRIFCGNAEAYAYILESLEHYPAQAGVASKMRDLGMLNVRIINLLGGAMSINYGEKKEE